MTAFSHSRPNLCRKASMDQPRQQEVLEIQPGGCPAPHQLRHRGRQARPCQARLACRRPARGQRPARQARQGPRPEAEHQLRGVTQWLRRTRGNVSRGTRGSSVQGWHQVRTSRGSGCSQAVEQILRDREIVGSNPAGCWAVYLLYPFRSASFIRALTTYFPVIDLYHWK